MFRKVEVIISKVLRSTSVLLVETTGEYHHQQQVTDKLNQQQQVTDKLNHQQQVTDKLNQQQQVTDKLNHQQQVTDKLNHQQQVTDKLNHIMLFRCHNKIILISYIRVVDVTFIVMCSTFKIVCPFQISTCLLLSLEQ